MALGNCMGPMISFALDMSGVRETLANLFNTHLRTWAGAAFVALAMLSIPI